MILLYSFVNFFNVWFNRKLLESHICFCIQTVLTLVLVDAYEENPASFNYTVAGEYRRI